MPTKLQEKQEELRGKQSLLHVVFDQAGQDIDFDKVTAIAGNSDAKLDQVKAWSAELDALFGEMQSLQELEDMAKKSADMQKYLTTAGSPMLHPEGGAAGEIKAAEGLFNLGKLFHQSDGLKAYRSGQQGIRTHFDIDLKTLFQTGAGWATEAIRLPRVELDPQRPIVVSDNVPFLSTGLDTIRYMEETTFTNNAVETAQSTATTDGDNATIGEAALALTERTQPVEWIPVYLPVTQQQMEDVEGIEDYVNSRLQYMLRQRLDSQILVGDGVTPNLLGTNNVTGINTQAKGTDPTPDAIYKGMRAVRSVGFAEPSVVFVHPNDWEDIRLLRTADGLYIFGGPMDAGPMRIWGVPVVQTTAATQNTITLGDYRNFSALYNKRGITMAISDSHSHFFTSGMLAIRADMRVAMVHYRPEAFTTVTGV